MITNSVPTYWAHIYMAGDIDQAKQVLRRRAVVGGLCATIEPLDFIYRGGEEAGFRVGLINYPRFPQTPESLIRDAIDLADDLRRDLYQSSYSVVTPNETLWSSNRDEERS